MARPGRRGSEAWARPSQSAEPAVQVLIPTYRRAMELAVTLAGLAAQDGPPFAVIVSDQSEGDPPWHEPAVASMVRVLEAQGRPVGPLRHHPRRGLAEHRQFLLDQATSDAVLFLDDDVWQEPGTVRRMSDALDVLQCVFVGSAVRDCRACLMTARPNAPRTHPGPEAYARSWSAATPTPSPAGHCTTPPT